MSRLGAENRAPGRLRRRVLFEERQHLAGAGDALAQRPLLPDVKRQRVAQRLAQAPSRQHIIADEGDAVRRKVLAGDFA